MLLLGVSEVVIHNKTGAQGDPTQLCLTSLTTFLKLKKKRYRINLRGISIPHGVRIPSQTTHLTTKPRTPPGGAGVCEVTHQPMTPAARHACATACQ